MPQQTNPPLGVSGIALASVGLFGNTLAPFLGMSTLFGTVCIATGVGVVVYGYFSNRKSKMDKLLLNCSLFVRTQTGMILLPTLKETHSDKTKTDYVFTFPPGMCLSDFRNKREAISQYLKSPVSFDYNNGVIIMSVYKVKLLKKYDFKLIHYDNPMQVCFAIGRNGPLMFDIEDAIHTLIAGSTGKGKSVLLRTLITALILDKKPEDIQLHLVDFMRVELGIFKRSNMVQSYTTKPDDFLELLYKIAAEAQKRLDLFDAESIVNLQKWNKKHKDKKMPYVIVIIDEFATLSDKAYKNIMNYFKIRTAQDRKAGIHYIICTQRPSVDVIDGTIKNNVETRIALKLATDTDSQTVLDENGAEKLECKGRCLIKRGDTTEAQVMYLDEDEAMELIKHTFINKQQPTEKKSGPLKGDLPNGTKKSTGTKDT